MASGGGSGNSGSRSLVLAWDVPPDQEEPWRRFLQELSGSRYETYAQSRRRLGVVTELVWLAPKPSGGGIAIVYLQADNPERVLGELAGSEAPFDSWYSAEMRKLFASIWRGYHGRRAASFFSPGAMKMFGASVRRPKKTAANEISR